MQRPRFPRIDRALHFTSEYFKIGRIVSCINQLAGDNNLSYLDTYHTITMEAHAEMEAEITQNIYGSNKNIQREMFEYLKDWLDNAWFLNSDYKPDIKEMIQQYNNEEWIKYEEEVREKEEEFKATVNYSIGHNVTIIKKHLGAFGLLGVRGEYEFPHTNMWFYSNLKESKAVNIAMLPDFFKMLDKIVESYKAACEKYVVRYFSGHIHSGADLIIEKQYLPPITTEQKLIEDKEADVKKLKFSLSIEHVACLFRLLKDEGLIEAKSNREVQRFILKYIATKEDADSVKKLENVFSTLEQKSLDFWKHKFRELITSTGNL